MNIAILYGKQKEFTTVQEHIQSFDQYSKYSITYFDIFTTNLTFKILKNFDVIVIHYTVTIFDDNRMPPSLLVLLHHHPAKKIAFIQDEHRSVNRMLERLKFINVNVIFSEMNPTEIEKVYSSKKFPNVIKIETLPGYIPEYLLKKYRPSYEERQLDIVYRARKLPEWLGEFAQEKYWIGQKFSKDARRYTLNVNISSKIEDRLYGKDWINFLKSSKAALGTEGGVSVFDFDHSLEKIVTQYKEKHPQATFKSIQAHCFAHLEGKVVCKVITPRCFEYITSGTLMVLYEGHYSGILKPWRHYIPLKKDHSNMKEIVEIIKDKNVWNKITECAYNEIALNPNYSYKAFIKSFDKTIESLLPQKKHDLKLKNDSFSMITLNSSNPIAKIESKIFIQKLKLLIEKTLNKLESIPLIGNRLKEYLIAKKTYIMKSCRLFYRFHKERKWNLILFCWNRNFQKEYDLWIDLQKYCQSIKATSGLNPVQISFISKNSTLSCAINTTEKAQNNPFVAFNSISKNTKISIITPDSCSIPDSLRNIHKTCINHSLAKEMLQRL